MAQCARIIDESTCFSSSDFVLLGRKLIINYSRLDKCVFDDTVIPLRKATTKNGQEEVVKVKCQTQAWKLFFNLLEQGDVALVQYQTKKRQEYMSVNQSSNCSLIGFMTTAAVAKPDFYNLRDNNDFRLLGGCNVSPMYSVGTIDPELEYIANRASETVVTINKTIRRQPTTLVDRAFNANGEPKFDVVLSYEEYWTVSSVAKPSERLKALQKKLNESYEANLKKIISDSEAKKNDDKKRSENFESLGNVVSDMNRVGNELSEHGDHPSCYRSRPLGLYRYNGRNRRPEIVLFLKNIYDAERSWDRGYYDQNLPTLNELVTLTYIHELMHAIMRIPTSFDYIEEPLAEMGMLCFVHDALQGEDLEKKALYWVKQKQKYESICHYGFGAFLYDSLYDAEVGWGVGNLMKQYIRMNKKLSENDAALADYEDYFLGGYPWHNLQRSALDKLFAALGTNRIKKNIRDSKSETLFKWESEVFKQNQQIESEKQQQRERIKEERIKNGEKYHWLLGFGDDIDEAPDININKSLGISSIIENIKNYDKNLGLKSIDPDSSTLQRFSSRYCPDIYIDYLLKILKDENSRKKLLGKLDDSTFFFIESTSSITLTRTEKGKDFHYELTIVY